MSRTPVAILGAAGQLGWELTRLLRQEPEWDLRTWDRQELDICNPAAVSHTLDAFQPAIVINAAAYTLVEQAETDPVGAFALNASAVASLASYCNRKGIYFIHFSTDYVFDGTLGRPLQEEDPIHPLNLYGLSKFAGEESIRVLHPNHCIIRTCSVFGFKKQFTPRNNFVEKILFQLENGKPLKVIDDLICTPTFTGDLSSITLQLMKKRAVGTYHGANQGACTWHAFATEIAQQAQYEVPIETVSYKNLSSKVNRPVCASFDISKIIRTGISPPPTWQQGLHIYLQRRPHEYSNR